MGGLQIHPTVFWTSAGIIISAVILSIFLIHGKDNPFQQIFGWVTANTGWFFITVANLILVFILFLLFSKFGHIRLGGPDAKPEFKIWGWFAMLFSAGMGIGLLFFSVAEPVNHLHAPPRLAAEALSPELKNAIKSVEEEQNGESSEFLLSDRKRAELSMVFTFFHWGLHAWAIYALVALSLAYFGFNKGYPLTIRSAFYPIFGKRVDGLLGDVIDILATVATLFGVATSLGLGVQQVYAGIDSVAPMPFAEDSQFGGVDLARWVQVGLIAAITAVATISVVRGLDKGIRFLSEFNMIVAAALLLFVFMVGPKIFLLDSLVQNIGNYFQHLFEISFWTEAYRGEGAGWQHNWTIFYWAWWIAWSPFVGMFIARVSKGRTLRVFILGVLLVPTALTFLWLTVFGNTAIFQEIFAEEKTVISTFLAEGADYDREMPKALFTMLQSLPLGLITSVIATIVIITFFVTSSDSGSLVIDIITAGGHPDPPVGQRIFWAVLEGVVAASLLLGGGLKALQTGAILSGLPFAVVLLIMCYGLYKGLRTSGKVPPPIETDTPGDGSGEQKNPEAEAEGEKEDNSGEAETAVPAGAATGSSK